MKDNAGLKRIVCAAMLSAAVTLFAGGSKDITDIPIASMESWQETTDISSKKKGKHNILITANDIAGNTAYVGPFNVYIDPDSDLPVTSIAFPVSGATVTGDVDIVGTCIDDDAVARISVRIDGGTEVYTAKGTEFWSYSLNTTEMEEGTHTIEVWGTDINGVDGKSVKTFFYLDRRQPLTYITNTDAGTLVSGVLRLEGSVEDGNGIERLFYSLDNGDKFEEVRLTYNKKTKRSDFKLIIDTEKIADGPNVCWFKSIDKQGSVGIYTFLFFVDNIAPSLSFIHPDDEAETFPSVFSVAGKASDGTGLESLNWISGNQSGTIALTPGNEYWVKEFDFSKSNVKSVTIEIVAKDVAGNVVRAKKKIEIDKKKDRPQLELVSPKPDALIDGDVFIAGLSYGNVSEVRYKIDREEEKTVSAPDGAFGFPVSGLSAGNHMLTLYAVCPNGTAGDIHTVKFKVAGKKPSISFENNSVIVPAFSAQNKVPTAVFIKAEAGLREAFVSFNGGEKNILTIKPGQTDFVWRPGINEKMPADLYDIRVFAADTAGRMLSQTLLVGIANPLNSQGVNRFAWAQKNIHDQPFAFIDSENPLEGFYYSSAGAGIENVELLDAPGLLYETDGNTIKIRAAKSGLYKNVRVKITDSEGVEFTSEPIDIFSDTAVPNITLNQNEAPIFVKDGFTVSGTVSSEQELESIEYHITTAASDEVLTGTLSAVFEKTVDIAQLPDGVLLFTVTASDKIGKKTSEHRVFIKDTQAPDVYMITPISGDTVNGSITASFKVSEKFRNVKAEYKAADEKSVWKEFAYTSLPNIVIGTADEPINKDMEFRFTDPAGNVKLINQYDFEIDNSADAPVVELHLPFENQIIYKAFTISGMIYDDDAAARIYYKIDDNPYQSFDVTHSFSVPVPLSSLTDNEHTITVYGEDIYGVKSTPVVRKIRVSLEPPSAHMVSPDISETVNGRVEISGTASDANGIKEVYISVNNGNVFSLAEGTENWKYSINTEVIGDGTHVVFIRTVDNYGIESISSGLINTDNTPPVLKIEYPLPGSALDTDLFISGQTRDNISLEGVTLKIKSLSGTAVPDSLAQIDLKTELLLAEDINISSLPEGRYNLEIGGVDKAGNVSEAAVNFDVRRKADKDKIELLYPLNGEKVYGEVSIYGRVDPSSKITQVSLFVDDRQVETVNVSQTHYVAFKGSPDLIGTGVRKIDIRGILPDNKLVTSIAHTIDYNAYGPWVTIDNLDMGDFAIDRPYLRGRAGYSVSQEEKDAALSKEASAEEKRIFAGKKLKKVEISFNNGKTFEPVRLKDGWQYRIETEDLAEGNHFLLVRAVMENEEIAVCRTIIKVDKTLPHITLVSPGEGGRYNGEMVFTGLASDNVGLQSVEAALRKGDKSSYGLPKFIQGLHVELGFWGATLWNMGVGLSFFDDNVKLQLHYGQFTQKQFDAITAFQKLEKRPLRYGGHVTSLKLLANITEQPFGYYFGPDWRWLYLNVAVGAQFSLFSQTQSGKPQVLSAILTQVEFPRVKLYKKKYFSSFSFFTEGQLWFIPTDVTSVSVKSLVPHICGGVRVDIF
ncbi:Ig-like domain-containing protein [Treponema sp. HNW]|uniref:Ig-like domain-containing protein n=1 Tax=Treponema sp. HNW TaxID=3116654 RepID=UPI003D0E918C